MVTVMSTVQVVRKGMKTRDEMPTLPVWSAHKDTSIPFSVVDFCHTVN
jgi:hypothetical protein